MEVDRTASVNKSEKLIQSFTTALAAGNQLENMLKAEMCLIQLCDVLNEREIEENVSWFMMKYFLKFILTFNRNF